VTERATLTWPQAIAVDVVRGNLATVRASGSFTNSIGACLASATLTSSIADATTPAPGGVNYYLVRPARRYCNEDPSWETGHPKEAPDRDGELLADPLHCP